MQALLQRTLSAFFGQTAHERLKITLLSGTYFLLIGGYTIIKELKDSIFMNVVGRTYIPSVKIYTLLALIPAVLLYSYLVDSLRRWRLLYVYGAVYGTVALVFAYLIGHPTIGLPNTQASPTRLFGWIFYFFTESYTPFVLGAFWAFMNSVSNPENAKRTYPTVTASSKLGGITGALVAIIIFNYLDPHRAIVAGTFAHQVATAVAGLCMIAAPLMIFFLMKYVPGSHLHGYEAVYQFEKERARVEHSEQKKMSPLASIWHGFKGMFSGLTALFQQPYILGIFGMLFMHDLIYTVFSYQRLGIVESSASGISDVSGSLLQMALLAHGVGFFVTLIGTRNIIAFFGERVCLILIPIMVGGLLLYLSFSYTTTAVYIVFVGMRAIHYGFSKPVIETLYIPTVKELKFKSKSWIDSFGVKFAKSCGSVFNNIADGVGTGLFATLHATMFIASVGIWLTTAFFLGRRFEQVVKNNEVIGQSSDVDI